MCFHGNCIIISQHNNNYDEQTLRNKLKILKNFHDYIIQSFMK